MRLGPTPPNEKAAWDAFVDDVRANTLSQIVDSACVISIAAEGEPDIKLAVETGLAVLLDKPIVAVAVGGRQVPPGLRRIAHSVVEIDDMDTAAGAQELQDKLLPILEELTT